MEVYQSFEERKKINMKDDPGGKEQNRITRKEGRHTQEILARYHQALEQYAELMRIDDDSAREQRAMLYSEVKTLGWVMCYQENAIIHDINAAVKGY